MFIVIVWILTFYESLAKNAIFASLGRRFLRTPFCESLVKFYSAVEIWREVCPEVTIFTEKSGQNTELLRRGDLIWRENCSLSLSFVKEWEFPFQFRAWGLRFQFSFFV